MLKKLRKSQSLTEYAILVSIVIASLVGMQLYAKRGLSARIKSATDAATGPTATITVDAVSAEFGSLNQYEPYYVAGKSTSYQESIKDQKVTTTGEVKAKIVSDLGATNAGGWNAEVAGSAAQTTRDSIWAPTP